MHISYRFTIYTLLLSLVAPTVLAQTTIPTDTKQSCAAGQYATVTNAGLVCFNAPVGESCPNENQAINQITSMGVQCRSLPAGTPTDTPPTCEDGQSLIQKSGKVICNEISILSGITQCGAGEFAIGFNTDGTPICDELPRDSEDTISVEPGEPNIVAKSLPLFKIITANIVIPPGLTTIIPNPIIPPYSPTITFPSTTPELIANKAWCHTVLSHKTATINAACTSAGGTVEIVDSSFCSICRFTQSSCPSGWTQHRNYSATVRTTSTGATGGATSSLNFNCTTGSHTFSNTPPERCWWQRAKKDTYSWERINNVVASGWQYARLSEIGCVPTH